MSFIVKVVTAHNCNLYYFFFFLETIFALSKTKISSEILAYPIYKIWIYSQDVTLEN